MNPYTRKLVTEDKQEYYGYAFGADTGSTVTELVFNTSPVGYQEIVSDPSYTDQTVVMAYPMIGNYGIAPQDFETSKPSIGGLAVRDYCDLPSNFRSEQTLSELLAQYNIPGIYGIDTRKLVRSIRTGGSCKVLMTDARTPIEEAAQIIHASELPHDAVDRVSRSSIQQYAIQSGKMHVVAVDCGMKQNIVRCLNNKGCNVTVVPWNTPAETVKALRPDGMIISNGPGNPEDAESVIKLVQKLKGTCPMFGICLGHQIIALACGGSTYKLKFGHRGGNHPVRNISTGRIDITSQNHSYAVDADSLKATSLNVTHLNIIDGTVEGIESVKDMLMGIQYHPESAPGPEDSLYLFDKFIKTMEVCKHA